jgi:hypothetical protein
MRTLGKAALALGFVGALGLSAAAPAQAQFHFNAPGVHIGIGPPHRHYWGPRYYDYYDYSPGGWNSWNGCAPG